MNKPLDVWLVDDDASIRWVLEKALRQSGMQPRAFEQADSVLTALGRGQPDVLITDVRMPGTSGLKLLETVREEHPRLPVIVMTAHSDLDTAVASYQGGAFEYLPKPFDIDQAVELVKRAAAQASLAEAAEPLVGHIPEILGQAPAMQEVFRAIGRLSRSSMTVLITGESGTGTARGPPSRSSRSTLRPSRRSCSNPSSSGTSAARSRAPSRSGAGGSSRPTAARYSSTRSATCRPRCRHGCCACWPRGSSIAWVGTLPSRSTSA
jgi:FixJ family two-component response regulator